MTASEVQQAIQRDRQDTIDRAALMSPLLDEVYMLRGLCALVALDINGVAGLGAKLPVSAKNKVREIQERLELAACGMSKKALAEQSTRRALLWAGASETLTRAQFEEELRAR